MSEQIRIHAKGKEKLNKNDLRSMTESINQTYKQSVESAKQIISAEMNNLNDAMKEVSSLYKEKNEIIKSLNEYNEKMDKIINENRHFGEKIDKKNKELKIAQQKLFIFKRIQELKDIKTELENNYKKMALSKQLITTFKDFKDKCSSVNLINIYDDTYKLYFSYYKENLNIFIESNDNKFSFNKFEEKLITLDYFNLRNSFVQFFWNYINQTFVKNISKSQCKINYENNVVSIIKQGENNTILEFFNLITDLLKFIIKVFETHHISIDNEILSTYTNNAMDIGSTLHGGKNEELKQAANELCKLTNVQDLNIGDVIKNARLPTVLDHCRSLLIEGKPFGFVISEMKQIMAGANTDGVLKLLATMAIVIWKKDRSKLEPAITPLLAVGTKEALECIMMFNEIINSNTV